VGEEGPASTAVRTLEEGGGGEEGRGREWEAVDEAEDRRVKLLQGQLSALQGQLLQVQGQLKGAGAGRSGQGALFVREDDRQLLPWGLRILSPPAPPPPPLNPAPALPSTQAPPSPPLPQPQPRLQSQPPATTPVTVTATVMGTARSQLRPGPGLPPGAAHVSGGHTHSLTPPFRPPGRGGAMSTHTGHRRGTLRPRAHPRVQGRHWTSGEGRTERRRQPGPGAYHSAPPAQRGPMAHLLTEQSMMPAHSLSRGDGEAPGASENPCPCPQCQGGQPLPGAWAAPTGSPRRTRSLAEGLSQRGGRGSRHRDVGDLNLEHGSLAEGGPYREERPLGRGGRGHGKEAQPHSYPPPHPTLIPTLTLTRNPPLTHMCTPSGSSHGLDLDHAGAPGYAVPQRPLPGALPRDRPANSSAAHEGPVGVPEAPWGGGDAQQGLPVGAAAARARGEAEQPARDLFPVHSGHEGALLGLGLGLGQELGRGHVSGDTHRSPSAGRGREARGAPAAGQLPAWLTGERGQGQGLGIQAGGTHAGQGGSACPRFNGLVAVAIDEHN